MIKDNPYHIINDKQSHTTHKKWKSSYEIMNIPDIIIEPKTTNTKWKKEIHNPKDNDIISQW